MSDWLSDVIGELRSEDIDWLRWMAANIQDEDLLEKLSQDPDSDVRMWVACNPMTSQPVLEKLADDPIVFVRRGVAQNGRTPPPVLAKLNDDADVVVRASLLLSRLSLDYSVQRVYETRSKTEGKGCLSAAFGWREISATAQ